MKSHIYRINNLSFVPLQRFRPQNVGKKRTPSVADIAHGQIRGRSEVFCHPRTKILEKVFDPKITNAVRAVFCYGTTERR